jgi:hypothetical protein
MITKILLCPYFGEFPPWFDLFLADFQRTLAPQGYKLLLDTDLPDFKRRVKEKLGVEYPGVRGNPKVWDYRCALGLLYEEEIKDYEYWGTADFDMVWGNVSKFIPDSLLSELDVYSSHNEYVCGCFSLYRNSPSVVDLFKSHVGWKAYMLDPNPNGWVEEGFSRTLEQSRLRYKYDFQQGDPWTKNPALQKIDNDLYQIINKVWHPIMFFHFRHSKKWPL